MSGKAEIRIEIAIINHDLFIVLFGIIYRYFVHSQNKNFNLQVSPLNDSPYIRIVIIYSGSYYIETIETIVSCYLLY